MTEIASVAFLGRRRSVTDEQRRALPVALVAMPLSEPVRPSIQIGLLAEIARRAGYRASTFHLYLDLAARIGVREYTELAEARQPMIGEWLFSVAAFGDDAPDLDGTLLDKAAPRHLEYVLAQCDRPRSWLDDVRRDVIPAYIDDMVATTDWSRFGVVGFTTTFQQNTASFALARRLKEAHPHLVTVFGGSNFDGAMGAEWVRSIACVDYAIIGEADESFPALLDALAADGDPLAVPGVLARGSDGGVAHGPDAVPFEDLDSSPVPDYSEFFERAEALGLLEPGRVRDIDIPYESARGCWWGEKRHCTFCGLNGTTMRFRSKSPERVLSDLSEVVRRYGSFRIEAVDNILDVSYLDELLRPLAESGAMFEIFYEIKANLSRDDLRRLAEGGVHRIQPGIESLNTHVLALMRKGIRAAHNVNTLRWGAYYGITVGWNILVGFPGETAEDYRYQSELIPHLVHLPAPKGHGFIRIDRFSPMFEDRERFPVRNLRPFTSYAVTYPSHVDLMSAAYHFDGDLEGMNDDVDYEPTFSAVDAWVDAWKCAPSDEPPSLDYWWAPGTLHIEDRRWPTTTGTYAFNDPLAALYVACSDAPVKAIDVAKATGLADRVDEVEGALDEFCRLGLMMRDGNLFLALALPARRGR